MIQRISGVVTARRTRTVQATFSAAISTFRWFGTAASQSNARAGASGRGSVRATSAGHGEDARSAR